MPYKNVEDRRAAWKRHYGRNVEKYVAKSAKQKEALRGLLKQLKESGKCADCGSSYAARAMDYHHSSDDKEKEVGNLVSYGSKKKLLEEIDKCILLCAVCHRLRH